MIGPEGKSGLAIIVSMISQKGGVGKSTLARLLAREFAAQEWRVKIADLDISQGTSFQWRARRLEHQIEPDIPVELFGRVDQALKAINTTCSFLTALLTVHRQPALLPRRAI
jgi:cellulose biosynthesis protein BcsQ